MKSAIIALLTIWLGYTGIKLVEARHQIRNKDLIMSATIEQCGESWLKIPLERQGHVIFTRRDKRSPYSFRGE